jgi:hypothetical protein
VPVANGQVLVKHENRLTFAINWRM